MSGHQRPLPAPHGRVAPFPAVRYLPLENRVLLVSLKTAFAAIISAVAVITSCAACLPTSSNSSSPARVVLAASLIVRQLQAGVLPMPGLTRLTQGDAGAVHSTLDTPTSVPLTAKQCRQLFGAPCLSAGQLAAGYGDGDPFAMGRTGKGVTVALPIPYGSDRLRHDLRRYSSQYGLPAPDLEIHRYGKFSPMPTPGDPTAPERYALAEEVTRAATLVHGIAPEAKIVVLETDGAAHGPYGAFGPLLDAMDAYAKTHPGVIFSLSYGTWESAAPKSVLTRMDAKLARISSHHATMVASTGDVALTSGAHTGNAVAWPASSPHVLAVAGISRHPDNNGYPTGFDTVWADHRLGVATGGGLSAVFNRPHYQDQVKDQVDDSRGNADFAMSISPWTMVYSSYNLLGGTISNTGGWYPIAGTSGSAPMFAAILASVEQHAHRPLGDIHRTLYWFGATAARRHRAGIADITHGCTTLPANPQSCAHVGWDPVIGNGTLDRAGLFVFEFSRALARGDGRPT